MTVQIGTRGLFSYSMSSYEEPLHFTHSADMYRPPNPPLGASLPEPAMTTMEPRRSSDFSEGAPSMITTGDLTTQILLHPAVLAIGGPDRAPCGVQVATIDGGLIDATVSWCDAQSAPWEAGTSMGTSTHRFHLALNIDNAATVELQAA